MPQLAIAAAGAAAGAAVGGTFLGVSAMAWGWTAGSVLGGILFAPKSQAQKADLRSPKIQLGAAMPRLYGTNRVALNPRWQSTWRADETSSGGKGGGGAEGYTYSCDLLTWISDIAGLPEELHVKGWSRLWWNGELVATRLLESGIESIEVDGGGKWSAITFHGGADDQLPWAIYETALGAENADAHRRVACISFEGLQAGTWSNLPLLEAEVYTSGEVDGLSAAIPYIVNDWVLSGDGLPVHDDAEVVCDSLRIWTELGNEEEPIAGTFDTLEEAMAEAAAAMGVAEAYVIAWSTSANELPSVFAGGATLADDPEYVYVYVGIQPIEHVLDGFRTYGNFDAQYAAVSMSPETPPYDSGGPFDGLTRALNVASWIGPGDAIAFQGIGTTRLVYSTFVEIPPVGFSSIQHAVDGYPPSYPSTDPGPPPAGYFPTVVGSDVVRIRVKRAPFLADDRYEPESGTYKALQEVAYSVGGVLVSNGVGPVLESSHPDYDDEAFWTAAAEAAEIDGDYGIDYPVEVSDVGVREADGVTLGTVDLADIVSAECLLAPGITAADIDVSELEGIEVRGFVAQGSPREAIEELMMAFQFYAVCSDKVYFRLLDAAAVLSIPHADTGAGVEQAGEPFTGLERGSDVEVPSEITIVSPNPSADYDAGAETSDRLVTASRRKESIQSAVVLTPAERKGRANALVMDARVGMHTGRLSVDDRYAEVEPGDVVTVADEEGNGYTVRVARESYAAGVHDCEVRLFDRSVLTLEGTTSDTYSPVITIPTPSDTDLVMLDTGLLRDADDGLHLMAAVKPSEAGRWTGASVYRSVDDASFSSVASTSARSIFGRATTALADFAGWTWDETGTVTVDTGGATLVSSSKEAMQADGSINVAALGIDGRWEIIRYRTATLGAPGVYTLTGLLRGLKGTEQYRGLHAVHDKFVKLSASTLQRIGVSAPELGVARYWKGVSAGQQVSAVDSQTVSPDGVALKPWAPVELRISRDSPPDAMITWHGRSRLSIRFGGPGGTYVQPDATLIGYRLRIYADDNFAAIVRTEDVTDPEFEYSAAEQTSDGLTPGDPISVRITQLSAVVGEGYILEGTA